MVVLDRLDAAGALTLFVLAGAALVPLSWLIGEATDNLAGHTGPVVLRAGRTTSLGGTILLVAYTVLVVAFYLSGDR